MTEVSEEYVVRPAGELDVATMAPLRDAWVEAIQTVQPARFVIDLADVTFLDSTALGAIVRAYKRQREHGGDVLVINVSRNVGKVFQLTRLDWLLDAHDPRRDLLP